MVALSLVLVSILGTLTERAKDQVCRVHAIWIKTMLRSAIFEKGLSLSPEERVSYPPEMIINMSTVDVDTVGLYVFRIHELWSSPLQLVTITLLVVRIMGSSALWGKIAIATFWLLPFAE